MPSIPSSYKTETLTGAEITKETQDQIGSALSFFNILLSTFSYIALGVGSFVIYNVFSISAAQRQRENASPPSNRCVKETSDTRNVDRVGSRWFVRLSHWSLCRNRFVKSTQCITEGSWN
jgi:hypothetical protein